MEIVCDFSVSPCTTPSYGLIKKTNHLLVIAQRAEWDENGLEMEKS